VHQSRELMNREDAVIKNKEILVKTNYGKIKKDIKK
jgi:hypothetical protein